jgi:hypothetical protein
MKRIPVELIDGDIYRNSVINRGLGFSSRPTSKIILKKCKRIGPIKEPSLKNYKFPDPLDKRFFSDIETSIRAKPDLFRIFQIGFSLYERAWTLRRMENLLMDFMIHPDFVNDLFSAKTDYNIAQLTEALKYDIAAI